MALTDNIKRTITVALFILLVLAVILLGNQKNFGPQQYGQLILDGIRGGTIYALIALGFVTIYNVTEIINFAQGAFVMLGAMITADLFARELLPSSGLNLIASIMAAIIITTLIGILVERLVIYPARRASPLTLIIITVGVYIVIQGVALIVWGSGALRLPAFTTFLTAETRDPTFRPFGIVVKAQSLWIWGITVLILIGVYQFFERSMVGKAFRACAINKDAARLMGIQPNRMSLFAFALAAALGAIGGIVLAPVTSPIYDMGLRLGLKGFVAAIVGGLVSAPAAVIGGILLGVIENIAAGVTQSGLKDIFAFIILILVLLYRPQGILTRAQETEKI